MRYFDFLASWLNIIAQPSAHLTGQAERRHAQLLSTVAFIMTILILFQNITIWKRYALTDPLFWAFWGQFLFVFCMYIMSRTKHYRLVRGVFTSGLSISILLITTLEAVKQETLAPMLWMILPILLTWLLGNTRGVIIITAATLLTILITYYTNPTLKDAMPGMPIGILLATTTLVTLYTEYQKKIIAGEKRYVENLYQANQQLEALLEQRDEQLQTETKERIRLDNALREAQHIKTVGLMAGVLAHDFNNFLSAILLEAGNVQGKLHHHHSVQQNLWRISESAERATLLSAKLLTYAKGSHPSEIKLFDLSSEVRELCQILRMNENTTLIVNIHNDTPYSIMGNQLDIQQLLMNLIINAGEAIPQSGGKIFVSVREIVVRPEDIDDYVPALQPHLGRYVQVRVKDTGRGMDEATQKNIFEPFFTTKTDKKAGRGLGLSSALGIIQSHDGALRLESAKGRGTTFSVLFPVPSAESLL